MKIWMAAAAMAAALGISACASSENGQAATGRVPAMSSSPATFDFVMGATNEKVGVIEVWNDADNLYVAYTMDAGYALEDAHVCVATSPLPWTPPGQCPYKEDGLDGATTFLFTIPLADIGADLCDHLLFLQVHGSVENETGEHVGSAYAGAFKGSVVYTVTCDPPVEFEGCTRTQGYWKNHEESWPVSSLTFGGVTYSQAELLALWSTPPHGDASIILEHQLAAALLNQAAGTEVPSDIGDALTSADAWMLANADGDGLPFGVKANEDETLPNPSAFDEGISLASTLDGYNNGLLGPLHCE